MWGGRYFSSCFCHIRKPKVYSHALLFMRVKHSKTSRRALTCFYTALIEIEEHFYLYQFIKSCFKVHEISQRRSRDNNTRINFKLPQNLSFLRHVSVKKNHRHCSHNMYQSDDSKFHRNKCLSEWSNRPSCINSIPQGEGGLLKGKVWHRLANTCGILGSVTINVS